MEIVLISLVALASFVLGFFVSRYFSVSKEALARMVYQGQQLLLMYMIQDEMFRRRFDTWSKSAQGIAYCEAVAERYRGVIFVPPIEDTTKVADIIRQIREEGGL